MEHIKSNIQYLPLDEEISSRIQVASEIVGDMSEDDKAAAYVKQLNADLIEAKLAGESVHIFSSTMIWTTERIDGDKTVIESVFDKELLKKTEVIATFVGIEEMPLDGVRTLMYRLSLDFDDATMSYKSVLAPVDESSMLVGTIGSVEAEITGSLKENVKKLSTIENPKFRETLKDLVNLLANTKEMNEKVLREVGVLTSWLMAADDLIKSTEMQDTLLSMLKGLLADNGVQHMVGQEIAFNEMEQGPKISISTHNSEAVVYGVAAVIDYEMDAANKATFETTLQPALIIIDEGGTKHYVPFKQITEFSAVNVDACQSSIQKFLRANPDFLRKMRA